MMKFLILALCVASAVAIGKRCNKGEDCEEGECCVNYVLISTFGGHCKSMRNEGESCTPLKKKGEDDTDMYHFQCPCNEGMECVAQHEIEILGHVVKHRPECVVPKQEDKEEDKEDNGEEEEKEDNGGEEEKEDSGEK